MWRRIAAEMPPLIALAVPLVAGLTSATIPSLVDTAMLGGLGEAVLGAVSLTSSLLLIFYAGLYGFVGPVGVLVGQAYGAGKPDSIAQIIWHGVAIAAVAGVGSAALMLLILQILPHTGQPPEVMAVIAPYWISMSLSLVPFVMSLVFKQFFDSVERPWVGFWLVALAMGGNIFINWLLIHGNWGFPALGLLGAGLGSFAGQALALLLMAGYYAFSGSTARYRGVPIWAWGSAVAQVREGTPMAIQYLLEGGAVAMAGIMIGWLGAMELAANQIVSSVAGLLYMLPLGMAAAVTIRVAQTAGAGEEERLSPITYAALILVSVWTVGFTILLVTMGDQIAALFVSEADLIALAAITFVTVGLMQVFDGVQSVSLGALRGILDNNWPTVVSLVGYWAIGLPVSYVAGVHFENGAAGVWAGFAVGLVFASVVLVWRIRRQFRKRAKRPIAHP